MTPLFQSKDKTSRLAGDRDSSGDQNVPYHHLPRSKLCDTHAEVGNACGNVIRGVPNVGHQVLELGRDHRIWMPFMPLSDTNVSL